MTITEMTVKQLQDWNLNLMAERAKIKRQQRLIARELDRRAQQAVIDQARKRLEQLEKDNR
jgi:hypothetical protein